MNIYKIIVIAIAATFTAVILRKTNPEYSIFLSIVTGVLIFTYITDYILKIKDVMTSLMDKFNLNNEMFSIVIKIIAVSYICEFASSICKDAGESSNALKIEFAGKIAIVFLTVPIIISLADLIFSII